MKNAKREDRRFSVNPLRKVVPMLFKASPLFFSLFVAVAFLHGISWSATVIVMQRFFDAVEKAIENRETLPSVYIALGYLALTVIGTQIVNGLHSFAYTPFNQKSIGYLMQKIHMKIAAIDPVEYENPEVLEEINKAQEGVNRVFGLVFCFVMIFTFFLPYLMVIGIYLFSLKPALSLALALSFIPLALSQLIRTGVFADLEDEAAPVRREFDHYEQCICGCEYFKETRILGAYGFFQNLYTSALRRLNAKMWQAEKLSYGLDFATRLITLAGYLGVIYLLVAALLSHEITVGAFVAVFASLAKLLELLGGLIGMTGDLGKNLGPVANFLKFLNMPEREGADIKIDFSKGINVNHISFRYPAAKHDSLRNVSLAIAPGEIIAIVGENGAGKTTLVRLLIGIYQPGEGSVEIGGVDTSKLSLKTAFQGISGVFQRYRRYQMTLRENVRISDVDAEADENQIGMALQKADIDMKGASFAGGLDTMLSRDFDGVDLSGGQWQRIAIARGLFRSHEMIVLDEPTAAIDPVEESRVYRKFSALAQDKTGILVTHRLGSARIANRIIVLDRGEVVEMGSHEELLAKRGKYFKMFTAQAQWYETASTSQV
jgi:ATP-binding cassette subfamily B protein